jgi:hypothetical protein
MSEINPTNTTDSTFEDSEKLSRQIDEQLKQNEELFRKLGIWSDDDDIDYLVKVGVEDCFNEIGYRFHAIGRNFKTIDDRNRIIVSVDVFLENDDCFVVVDVKSKPCEEDIACHIERLGKLKQYFMKHREKEKKLLEL